MEKVSHARSITQEPLLIRDPILPVTSPNRAWHVQPQCDRSDVGETIPYPLDKPIDLYESHFLFRVLSELLARVELCLTASQCSQAPSGRHLTSNTSLVSFSISIYYLSWQCR